MLLLGKGVVDKRQQIKVTSPVRISQKMPLFCPHLWMNVGACLNLRRGHSVFFSRKLALLVLPRWRDFLARLRKFPLSFVFQKVFLYAGLHIWQVENYLFSKGPNIMVSSWIVIKNKSANACKWFNMTKLMKLTCCQLCHLKVLPRKIFFP